MLVVSSRCLYIWIAYQIYSFHSALQVFSLETATILVALNWLGRLYGNLAAIDEWVG